MAEPYGLAYGLGAGLSNLPRAYAEGQRAAEQQSAMEMQNELTRRKMAEDEAFDKAMAVQQPTGEFLSPYEQQANWFETAAQQPGLGAQNILKLREAATKARGMAQTDTLQRAGRAVMLGDFATANRIAQRSGLDIGEIRPSSDPEFVEVISKQPGAPARRLRTAQIAAWMSTPPEKAMLTDLKFEGIEGQMERARMSDETKRYIAEMGDDTRRFIAEGNWAAAFKRVAAKQGLSGQKATAFQINAETYAKGLLRTGQAKTEEEAYAKAMERFAPGGGTVFSREMGQGERDRQFMLDLAKTFASMGNIKGAKEVVSDLTKPKGASSETQTFNPKTAQAVEVQDPRAINAVNTGQNPRHPKAFWSENGPSGKGWYSVNRSSDGKVFIKRVE